MATPTTDLPTGAEVPRDAAVLARLYHDLQLIRQFEERVRELRQSGTLQGSIHLYVGEEAVATGVCARLNPDDYVASTHRRWSTAIRRESASAHPGP